MQGTRRGRPSRKKKVVRADTLDKSRVSSRIATQLAHPDATPLHQIPGENQIEINLSKVENLIGKGHYGTALREANALEIDRDSPFNAHYEFILQEKIARTHIGIGDRYFIRGDNENAKQFYERAIQLETENATLRGVVELATQTFDRLLDKRQELFEGLKKSIEEDAYAEWCEKKNQVQTGTLIDVSEIRDVIFPDFVVEDILGERPPITPTPGWVDPLPPEADFIDFTSVTPSSVFSADTTRTVDVDITIPELERTELGEPNTSSSRRFETIPDNQIRASVAMPIVADVLTAKVRLFAIDRRLNLTGQAQGTVPLFRYEYLRGKTKEIISHIQDIESRMLPIQFQLDDFIEVVATIRRHLAEQEAELAATNQKIDQLVEVLATLAQVEKEMKKAVQLLEEAQNECDLEWYEYVLAGVGFLAAAAAFGLIASALSTISFGLGFLVVIPASIALGVLLVKTLTCDNVGTIGDSAKNVLTGLQQAIQENEAELNHTLTVRDILIAKIDALSFELSETQQRNDARVLNATTLSTIQTQYNVIRQSLLTRAQAIAKLTEEAFNFERDSEINLIKDSYFDRDTEGYTAAETLLRDLNGLDYIDVTGRTQKKIQLSQVISLQKHYPFSFVAIKAAGRCRFTPQLQEFDRWFPGTYMQQIKEVKVEILVDGKSAPVRGYISNDGVSFVRFADPGNKRKVDNVHIFAEPDPDLAQLCYKRFQRRRHTDTMAFPEFDSPLYQQRLHQLQERERNFFENVGLESSWVIELLPDQPIDLSRITDVLVSFQYEALFDENLKQVLQQKRYVGRRESAAFSVKELLKRESKVVDFSDTVTVDVLNGLFEAPAISKNIVNVGLAIKPKSITPLDGVAKLEVSFQGADPIQVATDERGVVATASGRPLGDGLADLEAMTHGKSVDGIWTLKILELPSGIGIDAVDDIFLLLNYEYSM